MLQLAPGESRTTRYNLIYTVPRSAEQDARTPQCCNACTIVALLCNHLMIEGIRPLLHYAPMPGTTHLLVPFPIL
eukprot:COSAG06_NODE_53802_length_298_cov_0.537688_1_plen_74_part_10